MYVSSHFFLWFCVLMMSTYRGRSRTSTKQVLNCVQKIFGHGHFNGTTPNEWDKQPEKSMELEVFNLQTDLLITSAFFASWWTLERQKRQQWFLLRRLACRTNDRSYNSTDSSLVTVHYQQRLLACFSLVPSPPAKGTGNETKLAWVAKLLIRQVHGHAAYYVIVCNCTCAFYSASATTTIL